MGKKLLLVFCGTLLLLGVSGWREQAGRLVLKPNIKDAVLKYFGSPEPEMDIVGTNFGAVQGTRNVQIDGTLVTALPGWSIIHWSNTTISLQAKDVIPWEHVYQIALVDGKMLISNILSKRFLYKFDGIKPTSGLVNSTFKLYVWDLPPAPGGLVLKMGSADCPIVSWGSSSGPIEARVPSVPGGTYEVFLQKGADVVSVKINFTVIALIKPPIIKK